MLIQEFKNSTQLSDIVIKTCVVGVP